MFYRRRIIGLTLDVDYLKADYARLSERYYELCRRHEQLVEALGMTRDERTIERYIRKGGPEQGP